jgi:hypothetical protein
VTVAEVFQLARRRWPVVLVGLLFTLVGAYQAIHAPGDYETSAGVYFQAPKGPYNANPYLPDDGGSVTTVASLVATAMNGQVIREELRAAGVRDRYDLELHNSGNQFVQIYNRPVLDLSVVGADPESVRRSTQLIVDRVRSELADRQQAVRAAPANWVTLQLTPADPPVVHGQGSRARALLATVLLGTILTMLAAGTVDVAIRRRHAGDRVPYGDPALAIFPSR